MIGKGKEDVPAGRVDFAAARTYPLSERHSKVHLDDFAAPAAPGRSAAELLERGVPGMLGGVTLRRIIAAIVNARRQGRSVGVGMGAHVIKCGLSTVLIDLMRRGVITSLAMNGGASIHDVEIALSARTSEDVAAGIADGRFGMAEETGRFHNEALRSIDAGSPQGMGRLLGEALLAAEAPFRDYSLLATGAALDIPVTVHVAIGTDIVHMHPAADGRLIGEAALRDFRIFTEALTDIAHGGVYANVGSAVVLPEVFLKAVTLLRNLGHPLFEFTTVALDFQQHYRVQENVLRRPIDGHGEGLALYGHHELLLPLLAQGIVEEMARHGWTA